MSKNGLTVDERKAIVNWSLQLDDKQYEMVKSYVESSINVRVEIVASTVLTLMGVVTTALVLRDDAISTNGKIGVSAFAVAGAIAYLTRGCQWIQSKIELRELTPQIRSLANMAPTLFENLSSMSGADYDEMFETNKRERVILRLSKVL